MKKTQKKTLDILLNSELLIAGVESEFSLRRVSKIKFGQNLIDCQMDPKEMERNVKNKDLSDFEDQDDANQ